MWKNIELVWEITNDVVKYMKKLVWHLIGLVKALYCTFEEKSHCTGNSSIVMFKFKQ